MVNRDEGQVYTIEGIAASVLLVITVYTVLSTTTILTPGDTHIIDLHLEQTGNDVLAVMDTPDYYSDISGTYNESALAFSIRTGDEAGFGSQFSTLADTTTLPDHPDRIKYNATVYYRNATSGQVEGHPFGGDLYRRENAVKVTRWVYLDGSAPLPGYLDPRSQSVLLEVLLWR
ncbi:hypothetical protein J2741_001254 [Methanolinea mesophila]|uniref:DUF7288 family protein n=1 Tax=Methanolinea mesophila TaxID=547055 RepID=UPI001AE99BAB|nr:hypothetical protein [Methanolinea mesophila]MBP1928707.1 hypothetical protein [Methanolinea mesophila]